jgi:hypothetical protein
MPFEKSLKKNAVPALRERRFYPQRLTDQRYIGVLTWLAAAGHKASPPDRCDWRFRSVSIAVTRRISAMQYSAIILRAG